jgi:hypothetical protein
VEVNFPSDFLFVSKLKSVGGHDILLLEVQAHLTVIKPLSTLILGLAATKTQQSAQIAQNLCTFVLEFP